MSCNVYNDVIALRGLLEKSSEYFDELFVVHSGPNGAYSTDGTIELCEQFGVKLVFDDIDKGFGVIRSRLIHEHGCEWAMILDADERFHPTMPQLICEGDATWDLGNPLVRPNLTVTQTENINIQGYALKEMIAQNDNIMAVRTIRRHWMDFTHKNPTQNWQLIPDYQLRTVRNVPEISYVSNIKMHERLLDSRTGEDPLHMVTNDFLIFHDHYHPFFRNNYPGKKQFNEQNYQRLERGEKMIPNG